jgi:hypothetical protein
MILSLWPEPCISLSFKINLKGIPSETKDEG